MFSISQEEIIKRFASDPSSKPPKGWWEKVKSKTKVQYPDKSEKEIDNIVGGIWYGMSQSSKEKTRHEEGKHYKSSSLTIDELEEKILKFFEDNPNPADSQVHRFAEELGYDPDQIETIIYSILSDKLE